MFDLCFGYNNIPTATQIKIALHHLIQNPSLLILILSVTKLGQ